MGDRYPLRNARVSLLIEEWALVRCHLLAALRSETTAHPATLKAIVAVIESAAGIAPGSSPREAPAPGKTTEE